MVSIRGDAGGTGPLHGEERSTKFNRALKAGPVSLDQFGIELPDYWHARGIDAWDDITSDRMVRVVGMTQPGEGAIFRNKDRTFAYKFWMPSRDGIGSVSSLKLSGGDVVESARRGDVVDLLDKIYVQTALGGTPTELLGMTREGIVVTKQPFGEYRIREETRGEGVASAGLEKLPPGIIKSNFPDDYYVASVNGEPWLVSDIREDNLIGDRERSERLLDILTGRIPAEVLAAKPEIAAAFERAKLKDGPERTLRLFASEPQQTTISKSDEIGDTSNYEQPGQISGALQDASNRGAGLPVPEGGSSVPRKLVREI